MESIINELLTRVDIVSGRIKKVGNQEANKVIMFDLENLKNEMKLEDLFYDIVLEKIAKKTNRTIEFKCVDGANKVIFRR